MQTVKLFQYDRWVDINFSSLQSGDVFVVDGKTLVASAKPILSEDNTVLNADVYDYGCHHLDFQKGRDYLCMALDFVNSLAHDFGDGTVQVCNFAKGDTNVYSPRLPVMELNEFCKTHIDRYEAFYRSHKKRLQAGVLVDFPKFW